MSEPFPPTALQRRYAQTVRDSSSSYKIGYVIVIKNFLNPKGNQNPLNGSKVTVILLKGGTLPIGEASAVEGLRSTGLPRQISLTSSCNKTQKLFYLLVSDPRPGLRFLVTDKTQNLGNPQIPHVIISLNIATIP